MRFPQFEDGLDAAFALPKTGERKDRLAVRPCFQVSASRTHANHANYANVRLEALFYKGLSLALGLLTFANDLLTHHQCHKKTA